jgi:N12 class adenine-specific DNA methylase
VQVGGIIAARAVGKVDEAHHYKNKQRMCNIDELSCPTASQRAEDLALKLDVLRQRRRDEACAAGILVANSLGGCGLCNSTFGPTCWKPREWPTWGTGRSVHRHSHHHRSQRHRHQTAPVTRVGKYTNLPDLLALSAAYTDVVTRDQVPIPLPALRHGQRQIISLQPDTEVSDFIADLGWRADHLDAKDPSRDNILKIANDGRNASLDPRLAHLSGPTNSRAAAVAE